jgi:hypothetical protein
MVMIVLWAGAVAALPVRGDAPDSLSAVAAAREMVGTGAQVRRADSILTQIAVEFADSAWCARSYDYEFRFDHSGSAQAVLLGTPIDMESACRVLNSVRPRLHAGETISSIRSFDDFFTGFGADGKDVLSDSELDGRVGVWTRIPGAAGGRIFSVHALGDTLTTKIAGQWYY